MRAEHGALRRAVARAFLVAVTVLATLAVASSPAAAATSTLSAAGEGRKRQRATRCRRAAHDGDDERDVVDR